MIPILYDHFETSFTSQGVGRLSECISCKVLEQVNGEYECTFAYPVSGELFQRLVNYGGIIAATHDHNGDLQPFDIYAYEAPIDGIVTFRAHHISYRLSNLIVGDRFDIVPAAAWGGNTPAAAFAMIPIVALTSVEFSFSDLSGYPEVPDRTFEIHGRASVRDGLLNGLRTDNPVTGTEALYKVFPGEFVFDKFAVRFYRKRGSNRGVQIRYGKNMTDVTRERDWGSLVSAAFPYWVGEVEGPGGEPAVQIVTGDQVFSPMCEISYAPWEYALNGFGMETPDGDPYYFGAADRRAAAVDFSGQFSSAPTVAELNQAALDWMEKNSTWRAFDNITVTFADLYGELGELEKCSVGDYVDVIYPALGIICENVEIVQAVYDTLAERFDEMELGDLKTSYAQTIIETMQGGIKA